MDILTDWLTYLFGMTHMWKHLLPYYCTYVWVTTYISTSGDHEHTAFGKPGGIKSIHFGSVEYKLQLIKV